MMEVSTTAVPTTATNERATLPPVACAPWCHDGNGHAESWSVGDQWCFSEATTVELDAEDLDVYTGSDGVTLASKATLSAYLCREAYSTRSLVSVTHNELTDVKLTGPEAIALGEALVRFGREASA